VTYLEYTLFSTEYGSHYLYSVKRNQLLLLHPILHFLLSLKQKNTVFTEFIKSINKSGIDIDGYGNCSKKILLYYYEKMKFLDDQEFLEPVDTEKRINYRLNGQDIRSALANSTHLTFEVTEKCNLHCDYCIYGKYYEDYEPRDKRDLHVEIARRVLEYMFPLWNSDLNLSYNNMLMIGFYGGEPLLRMPFIEEIVRFVKMNEKCRQYFSFSLTTNGLLLDRYMDFLVENNFKLLISLDGNKKNNEYRFKSNTDLFEKLITNITTLKAKYPEYFESQVSFNAVLHNKNSFAEIYEFFKTTFDKNPGISTLAPVGIKPGEKENFLSIYKNLYESKIAAGKNSLTYDKDTLSGEIADAVHLLHKCSGYVFKRYDELLNPDQNKISIPSGTCIPFSKKIFITATGKILPCERIGHHYALGTVDTKNVELDFEKIAEHFNCELDKIQKSCNRCSHIQFCPNCIYYMDHENEKLKCDDLLTPIDFSRHLSSIFSYLEKEPGLYQKAITGVVSL